MTWQRTHIGLRAPRFLDEQPSAFVVGVGARAAVGD
jgi:hypothetical protein